MKNLIKCICLITIVIYIGFNSRNYATYTGNDPWGVKPKCYNSKSHTARLVRLANITHSVLDSMEIDHWLVYGSLWGPLRGIQGPLPWDHDVDFGIRGEGKFSKISLAEFKSRFIAAGLGVTDRYKMTGAFTVGGSIDVFVFYDYRGNLWRGGYEPWIFFVNYWLYHSFPTKLVQPPLSKVRFGSFDAPFPQDGMEMVKHLYPFSWWKIVTPPGCEDYYRIDIDKNNLTIMRKKEKTD